jgi:Fe-S cluster assembly iron-binding protein IscA
MPKQTIPLTDTKIRKAKPNLKDGKPTQQYLYDGHGLRVLVRPSGTKSFQLHYKLHDKWKTYTIHGFLYRT